MAFKDYSVEERIVGKHFKTQGLGETKINK